MATNSVEVLRTIPLFAGVDDAGLARIAAVGFDFAAEPGHVLVEHGHPGNGCFLIEEGTVRVELPNGETLVRGPGEFFGELSLLTESTRTARVVAASAVRCIAIRRHDLEPLLHEEPAIAIAMLRQIATRLAEAT